MRAIDCPVSPDELRNLVLNQKLTEAQVAVLLPGGTIRRVQSWKRRFGIETPKRWERHQLPPIEGRLRSLLVGSMLGDGRLVRQVNATHYSERHSGDQDTYLRWKAEQWGAWAGKVKPIPDKRGYTLFGFFTKAHADLNPWQEMFYPDHKRGWKRLLPAVVDLVDEFALAVWYLDDGCAGWWPNITFGADPGSRGVAHAIFEKFGLAPRWQPHKGQTGYFHMERESTAERFLELIRPHVPECMSYKLGPFGFQGPHYEVRQKATPEALREMAAAGIPIRRMATQLGVGQATVDRWLIKLSIEHPCRGRVGRPSKLEGG